MSVPDFVEWSEELSVGIQELDEQHKYLLNIINQLNVLMLTRKNQEAINEMMDRLIEYTRTHFIVEESLMRILGYVNYDMHKQHHDDLIAKVLDFKNLQMAGKLSRVELMDFLAAWLTNHILKEDKLYSEHFLKKGAQRSWGKTSWMRKFWGG